ncbi:MAG: glutathione synthase [Gammaproteobacteria bacterium]|nr:MAG: glutathione synthase [Gammaproteobacteria bacterium]
MEGKLGVVMDPIAAIDIHKDSTFAMLLEAQRRGWTLFYMEQKDLLLRQEEPWGIMAPLRVKEDPGDWFQLGERRLAPLKALQVILMRKDPPFDMEYIYTTYLLERAEAQGTLVVNRPRGLRDVNEKIAITQFPQCIPPTLVTRSQDHLLAFLEEQGAIVLKPLETMGGKSVFYLEKGDANTRVILETMTRFGQRFVMAQRFIPDIRTTGDKRILLIDGEPVPYALARIPLSGEIRANLAVGGEGKGVALDDRDRWICQQVGPVMREKGLMFVGLDVIGEWLTEINVTSPTGIRQLDALYGLNICRQLFDRVEAHL